MPVRKRGDRWQVRVALGDGRRLERTLPPGASRTDALDAEAHLRRQQVDVAAGRDPARLIDAALDRWEAGDARRLKSYQRDLRYRLAVLRQWTRGRSLDQIPDVAEQVRADGLASGLSAAGVNRYLAILRRVANLARDWGWTDKPLGSRVKLTPGEASRHVYLTAAQVRALMDGCRLPEVRDLILFAALTGLRRGEILRLTPENLRGGAIVLGSETKSGRPRVVPMPPQAARIAQERVPFTVGAPLLSKVFREAREAAGLPHVRLHDLRHTFASWLAQGGASMAVLRDLLGHSSLAVTSRYAHLARPDLAEAVERLRV